VKNPVFHNRSKHIDVRLFRTRSIRERSPIEIVHKSSTDDMTADILIKELAKTKLLRCIGLLGIGSDAISADHCSSFKGKC